MISRQELADEYCDDLLFLDGPEFDVAILGVVQQFGKSPAVCYDLAKILEVLVADGMTYEEAEEYWSYNMLGSFVGDTTPVYLSLPLST